MIYVIATIQVAEGKRDAFLKEFFEIVPLVQQEEGCIEYGPTLDVDTSIPAQGGARTHVVSVVEKWEDLESLEAHLIAPHMIEYRGKVKPLVVSTQLQILQPVSASPA